STNTPGSELVMMTPYLHFTGGDNLFFKSWHPSSRGAIAGASVALLMLAMSERLLFAVRRAMDTHWRKSILAPIRSIEGDVKFLRKQGAEVQVDDSSSARRPNNERRIRTVPPFVLSHDAARGALYSLQALLSYALMLSVMTFQAAYIISVIVGLGLGELLFGR
ncbi:Ctr copper transporter, partial [Multifurca ochricompacta]